MFLVSKKIAIFVVLTYPASIFTKKAVSYTVLKIEKYYNINHEAFLFTPWFEGTIKKKKN